MAWYDPITTIINLISKKPTPPQWYAALQAYIDKIELMCLDLVEVSTTHRGLVPKLDGNATHFLRSDGTQAVPAGTGIGLGGASGAVDGAILLADGENTDTIKGSGITIETSLTDDDTKSPTSGAVYSAVAAVATETIPVTRGGTGLTTITAGDLLYGDGANSIGKLAASGNGSKALVMNSGATTPEYKHAVRTLILSGAGGYPATTLPDAGFLTVEMTTNDVDVRGTKFAHSAAALSYHVWATPMPENYNGGTMTAQFFWTTNTAGGTGNIRWQIQMLSRADDEALDAAWGTAVGVTDTILAVNDQHISTATAAITPAGTPAGGEMMYFRVARDFANGDTSTADAILLAVRLAYTTDNYSDE